MQRIKLKKKKNTKIKKLLVVITMLLIFLILPLFKMASKINGLIVELSEIEIKKISKIILSEAVNKTIVDCIDLGNIFDIEKDSAGSIKMIDINSKKSNEILILINSNVSNYINELEHGRSSIVDIRKNLITNGDIVSKKEGIIFEIPIGIITKNAFFSNLGPKIPVRVSLNGDLHSEIKTSIESYGINNALLKVFISLKISERIIMPLTTREISVSNDIPIAMKMIQGDIPSYYFNELNHNKASDNN